VLSGVNVSHGCWALAEREEVTVELLADVEVLRKYADTLTCFLMEFEAEWIVSANKQHPFANHRVRDWFECYYQEGVESLSSNPLSRNRRADGDNKW
jgi:hypothetical protein